MRLIDGDVLIKKIIELKFDGNVIEIEQERIDSKMKLKEEQNATNDES